MRYLVVITTTDERSVAEDLARQAVERQLAACVQIVGPVTSVYRWRGTVETGLEFRCELKTSADHFSSLANLIHEIHNYDLPEVIAIPIEQASEQYADWLHDELGGV